MAAFSELASSLKCCPVIAAFCGNATCSVQVENRFIPFFFFRCHRHQSLLKEKKKIAAGRLRHEMLFTSHYIIPQKPLFLSVFAG
jgi:hypothetical protein